MRLFRPAKQNSKLSALILGVLGLGHLIWAGLSFRDTRQFLTNAQQTTGTVAELISSKSSGGARGIRSNSVSYYPRIRFEAAGQPYFFEGTTGSNPPAYQPGQQVTVLYNPANPQDAKIPGFLGFWSLEVILGIVGLGLLFLAGSIKKRADTISTLKISGNKVQATVLEVRIQSRTRHIHDTSSIASAPTMVVVCQANDPLTGGVRIYTSDPINTNHVPVGPGALVWVYVDSKDPSKYYVEIPEGQVSAA